MLELTLPLQKAGYIVQHDNKGRYIQGMIRLVDDLSVLECLRDAYMVRLFSNAQLRKGKAFAYKQLQQIAEPGENIERFLEQMQVLAAKHVFLRGYHLRCPICDLATWYALSEVAEQVTCQGCRIPFQMPLDLPFAYRPNRLFMEGLKSGALTILLTLLWLHEEYEQVMWECGIVVRKDKEKTDLDILARCDGELFVIECKDNFKISADELAALQAQLSLGHDVASDLKAQFFFATLYEKQFPDLLQATLMKAGFRVLSREILLR